MGRLLRGLLNLLKRLLLLRFSFLHLDNVIIRSWTIETIDVIAAIR